MHLVYDASKSGLNRSLWAPSFHLPSVDALIQVMDSNSWIGVLDLGDKFLYFPFNVALRRHISYSCYPGSKELGAVVPLHDGCHASPSRHFILLLRW